MDYDALSACLIRRVRGTMSKDQLSRLLGFSSNVLNMWERQERLPDIGTFFRMAKVRRLRFAGALAELLDTAAHSEQSASDHSDIPVSTVIRRLVGKRPVSELARVSGFDRATLARWRAGKTAPRLPDFLAFLDKTTHRVFDFVALFADPRTMEPTRAAYEEHQERQRIAYAMPWSSAVLHALELAEYQALPKHDTQLLAKKLGLANDEVDRLLQHLVKARLIEEQDRRYRPTRILTVNTQRDFAANRRLKRHWAAVASARLERLEPDHQSLFSYNVFPVGHADLILLRQLHLDYYHRVRHLVANASGAAHMVVMNVQLCVLDEVAKPRGQADTHASPKEWR